MSRATSRKGPSSRGYTAITIWVSQPIVAALDSLVATENAALPFGAPRVTRTSVVLASVGRLMDERHPGDGRLEEAKRKGGKRAER